MAQSGFSPNVIIESSTVSSPLALVGRDSVEAISERPIATPASIESRVQQALKECYREYSRLPHLFDETSVSIADSFIQLALIKETERKQKEKKLGQALSLNSAEGDPDKKVSRMIWDDRDERLASFEELYAVKEPLALTQLFEPNEDSLCPKKLLILGRAGIGKTVLCQYLVTQWAGVLANPGIAASSVDSSLGPRVAFSAAAAANREDGLEEKSGDYPEEAVVTFEKESTENPFDSDAFQLHQYLNSKFKAIFWLKLRELASFMVEYDTFCDVLHQNCLKSTKTLSVKELEYFLSNNAERVLFILDGYDEITDQINEPQYRPLNRFLTTFGDPRFNVLLTSRPMEIETLRQFKIKEFDRRLENMGFSKTHIEVYTQRFMQDMGKPPVESSSMIQFMKAWPSVWGIAHIPINLELLCWLWARGKLNFRPNQKVSLSRLYCMIVKRISEAYQEKHSQRQASAPLEKMGQDQSSGYDLANDFLGRLAYRAMEEKSIVISDELIQSVLDELLQENEYRLNGLNQKKILEIATDKLGFLKSTQEGGASILDQKHYFIHLSFQEFFAARYIANVLIHEANTPKSNQMLRRIAEEKYIPRYQLIWWLTAGLLYQHGCGKTIDPSKLYVPLMQSAASSAAAESAVAPQRQFSALLSFWRAILAEPRDLIGEYHIALIMHCLDECEGDGSIALHQALMKQQVKWLLFSYGKLKTHWGQCVLLQPSLQYYLLESTKASNPKVRSAAFKVLGNLKNLTPDMMAVLLKGASDADGDVRSAAIRGLNNLKELTPDAMAALLTGASDADDRVRYATKEGLKNFKDLLPDAAALLLKDASDANQRNRCAAMQDLKDPSLAVMERWLQNAKDANEYIRSAAIHKLGNLKYLTPAVMTLLLRSVYDASKYVRHDAMWALSNLKDLPPDAMVALLAGANDANRDMRHVAMSTLTRLKHDSTPDIAAVFLKGASDADRYVRFAAIQGLGNLKNLTPDVMAALLSGVNDAERGIRFAAISALRNFEEPSSDDAIAVFLAGASDVDEHVRFAAMKGLWNLKELTPGAMVVLLASVRDVNADVRDAALRALSSWMDVNRGIISCLFEQAATGNPEYIPQYIRFLLEKCRFIYLKERQIICSPQHAVYVIPMSPENISAFKERATLFAKKEGRPADIYNLSGYESEKTEQTVLQGNNNLTQGVPYIISNQRWVVHLVANKKGQHAFLVIEGLEHEQHFAKRYDLVLIDHRSLGRTMLDSSLSVRVDAQVIEPREKDYLPKLQLEQSHYECQSWEIEPALGRKLIDCIQEDINKGPNIPFRITGGGSITESPNALPSHAGLFGSQRREMDRFYNCLTWAEEKLQQINITRGQSWFRFHIAAVPSWAVAKKEEWSCRLS